MFQVVIFAPMSKMRQISAHIKEPNAEGVDKLAKEYNNSFSRIVDLLIEEALTARANAKYKEDKLTLTDALINQKE